MSEFETRMVIGRLADTIIAYNRAMEKYMAELRANREATNSLTKAIQELTDVVKQKK